MLVVNFGVPFMPVVNYGVPSMPAGAFKTCIIRCTCMPFSIWNLEVMLKVVVTRSPYAAFLFGVI